MHFPLDFLVKPLYIKRQLVISAQITKTRNKGESADEVRNQESSIQEDGRQEGCGQEGYQEGSQEGHQEGQQEDREEGCQAT